MRLHSPDIRDSRECPSTEKDTQKETKQISEVRQVEERGKMFKQKPSVEKKEVKERVHKYERQSCMMKGTKEKCIVQGETEAEKEKGNVKVDPGQGNPDVENGQRGHEIKSDKRIQQRLKEDAVMTIDDGPEVKHYPNYTQLRRGIKRPGEPSSCEEDGPIRTSLQTPKRFSDSAVDLNGIQVNPVLRNIDFSAKITGVSSKRRRPVLMGRRYPLRSRQRLSIGQNNLERWPAVGSNQHSRPQLPGWPCDIHPEDYDVETMLLWRNLQEQNAMGQAKARMVSTIC